MTDYTIPRANAPIAGTEAPTIQWYNYLRFLDTRTSSASGDVQAEITTIAEKLGSPDGTVGNIPPQGNVRSVQGLQSVTAIGASIVQLALVNDVTIVDPVYYYGTDSTGTKGYNLLYSAFASTANIAKINTAGIVSFDLTDLADSGSGTLLATTFDAKGRKTGSRAATITGAAGRVTVANGDASAGLPTIDLATLSDAGGGVLLGFTRDSWGRVSGTHAITVAGTTNRVTVTGGTGSGATITLSAPQDIATTSTPTFAQVALAADPTTALQAATKQYVDSVAAGLSPKAPTLLATTTNDTLSGLAARDGFAPSSGDRVLVKNQTLPAQNGIYIASVAAWTRATDMAAWSQVPSAYLWVEEGTINADTGWVCTSDPGGVIGVTAITFVQFGGNGTVTAGAGITVAGNQVSLGTPSTVTGATTNAATGITHTHALTVTKSDVGLSNVDNTSDANKPVSTAQATSISTKLSKTGDAATGNYTFDSSTLVVDATNHRVGMGTPTPQRPAHIVGANGSIGTLPSSVGGAHVFIVENNGNCFSHFLVGTGSGGGVLFSKSGDTSYSAGFIYDSVSGSISLGTTGSNRLTVGNTASYPTADNAYSCGLSANRWSVVYAATGAINTSDAREKTVVTPLTPNEIAAATDMARSIGRYQWLASIAEKGDKARSHVGLTVQNAIAIMQSHNLDPMRYGFICYDKWDELPDVKDGDGVITQSYRAAGDRYSFRMDELNLFIARGFAARLDALEAKT